MLGCNLLDTGFAKMLILNPENWGNADRLHFEFANSVYITLYNPNFVVFYIGIILPITIYLCFTSKGIIKKKYYLQPRALQRFSAWSGQVPQPDGWQSVSRY